MAGSDALPSSTFFRKSSYRYVVLELLIKVAFSVKTGIQTSIGVNKIHHWCSVGTAKSQPLGPLFKWETRLYTLKFLITVVQAKVTNIENRRLPIVWNVMMSNVACRLSQI